MTEATLLAQIIVIVIIGGVIVISVNNLEFYSTETSSQSGKKVLFTMLTIYNYPQAVSY
jgi:hypothetical protein